MKRLECALAMKGLTVMIVPSDIVLVNVESSMGKRSGILELVLMTKVGN